MRLFHLVGYWAFCALDRLPWLDGFVWPAWLFTPQAGTPIDPSDPRPAVPWLPGEGAPGLMSWGVGPRPPVGPLAP